MNEVELTAYLNESVQRLFAAVLKETLSNPRETQFLLTQVRHQKKQAELRNTRDSEGKHTPAFLIASITQQCNLHCSGCYSRGRNMCLDVPKVEQLSADEWKRVFQEAEELGVSFCILAGGEPLLRKDVLNVAGAQKKMIFPVFTNGTLFCEEYYALFDTCRNLVPIFSLEGKEKETDSRRGSGIYQKITEIASNLKQRKILFGVSITVTSMNYQNILSEEYLHELEENGFQVVFLVAYSATTSDTKNLELNESDRKSMQNILLTARKEHQKLWFLSFPGDEEFMGGCLAAGRGFFHISPTGAAEPCPFSPYSDRNIKDVSLEEALSSPFFRRLNASKFVGGDHDGGCALLEHEDEVKNLL